MPQNFWDKVQACEHEWSPTYLEHYGCTCGQASESRCVKCGVYVTEDPCGEQSGMSGWSKKRVMAFLRLPSAP